MKIESISIQNFKRFSSQEPYPVAFKNKALDEISDRYLIIGDNGTGKTTLLQAIALPLSMATRQITSISDFDWIGFLPGRYRSWGAPRIELIVTFEIEEIEATREVAHRWYESTPEHFWMQNKFVEPGTSQTVRLTLDGEKCRADNAKELFQFHGRAYVMQLLKTDPGIRRYFPQLPGIFWFDQFRNLGTTSRLLGNENGNGYSTGRMAYEPGVASLRRYLNGWKLAQQSRSVRYQVNYLNELETLYQSVFPQRSFAGVELMPGVDTPTAEDFYFLLNDGARTYDIAEASAGEQSVFPVLYEFVRQQIAHSVVLIDEIDLNLHPPAAQEFVRQLPKICPTCQFIFTTHSDAVSDIISEAETHRLPGGTLCL